MSSGVVMAPRMSLLPTAQSHVKKEGWARDYDAICPPAGIPRPGGGPGEETHLKCIKQKFLWRIIF